MSKQSYRHFQLINSAAVMPRWDRDYALGLRHLILKYSKKRFSFLCEPNTVLPKVPKIDSVFSVLGAKNSLNSSLKKFTYLLLQPTRLIVITKLTFPTL